MAPQSSLSPAAPAYIPKRGAPWFPPPPPPVPGSTAYYVCAPPPPPPPGFIPLPPLDPPPHPPCWSIPQVPCFPEMQGTFHGGVVPHGAVGMTMPSVPAPATQPRRLLKPTRTQGAAGRAPAATAASCRAKAAGDAKEAATNQPSPRSVLVAPSPPISPTMSLPASFPYQLMLPASPLPATAGVSVTSATAPSPAEGSVAVGPPRRRRRLRGPRRARPASTVRRADPKPRLLFDASSERTSLMIRNIPNDFTRMRLMNIIDQHCLIENERIGPGGVRSEYDFLYLTFDFRSHANKGYAFVNMTSPEAARRLWVHLHGYRWAFKGTNKTCAVNYADRQGTELVERFSGTRFDCHTEEYLPVRFEPPRDGARPARGAMHVVGRLARPRAGNGK